MLEKVNLAPPTIGWSNLVKLVKKLVLFGTGRYTPKLQAELGKEGEAVDWELAASVTPAEPMVSPTSPNEKKFDKKEPSMKAAAQATVGVKELLLLDPP